MKQTGLVTEIDTLESLMRKSPFDFVREQVATYAIIGDVTYTYPDGRPMTRNEWYWAMCKEREHWDGITLKTAEDERAELKHKEYLPKWLLAAERDSFARQRIVNAPC